MPGQNPQQPEPAVRLSTNLALPLDLVTETVAILAKRRAGKSYTARRLAEQLLSAGLQVVERSLQSASSSGYANNLGSLRSLGLLDYPSQGIVAATELLFPVLA